MKNSIVKDALILFMITVIAGIGLGAIYGITKEPIAQANYTKTQNAYKAVFADADSFTELPTLEFEEAVAYVTDTGSTDTISTVQQALDASGNLMGYVVTITSHEGYGGDITFSIGVTLDKVLNGYSITTINETAGLGMKSKEEGFSSQFNNKQVDQFTVVKTGSTNDSEIDAISGATITSNAVTNGVNSGLLCAGYLIDTLGGEVVNE